MRRNKLFFLKYLLLFVPILLLTYCQESNEDIVDSPENILAVDSQLSILVKSAIEEDDNGDQCVNFVYPIEFYAYFPEIQSMQFISITNDEELYSFFDTLTSEQEVRIDFPVFIIDTDGVETAINSLDEMEEILQVVVDACRGSEEEYDYCDDNNKKVYICHNGNTLCVSINAIKAHLDHGDLLGQCE